MLAKWILISSFLGSVAYGNTSTCSSLQGICLDGKRSDFFPDESSLTIDNCLGYGESLGAFCVIERGARDFSWRVRPSSSFRPEEGLFFGNDLSAEVEFPILSGNDLALFRAYSPFYTIAAEFYVSFVGYYPSQTNILGYSSRSDVSLVCDGTEIKRAPLQTTGLEAARNGTVLYSQNLTGLFSDFDSSLCKESLGVKLKFRGQKLRIDRLSISVLRQI